MASLVFYIIFCEEKIQRLFEYVDEILINSELSYVHWLFICRVLGSAWRWSGVDEMFG